MRGGAPRKALLSCQNPAQLLLCAGLSLFLTKNAVAESGKRQGVYFSGGATYYKLNINNGPLNVANAHFTSAIGWTGEIGYQSSAWTLGLRGDYISQTIVVAQINSELTQYPFAIVGGFRVGDVFFARPLFGLGWVFGNNLELKGTSSGDYEWSKAGPFALAGLELGFQPWMFLGLVIEGGYRYVGVTQLERSNRTKITANTSGFYARGGIRFLF